MSRRQHDDREKEQLPVSPRALGVAFGLWITFMVLLAFVVVPFLFATCAPPS